jgi:RNA polymerase sigma factor (sigma-70 family)
MTDYDYFTSIKSCFPIGMYIILIGVFFSRSTLILVLIRQSKLNIMKAKMDDSDTQFLNLHQDLIDGCRRCDQKAQFQIYKLYYKAMYNTSLRIVNDTMEAEDIMQEAFLSAFEKIDSYSGKVSFGSWLKKIVTNRSLDYLSKKSIVCYKDIESFQEMEDTTTYQSEESDPRVGTIMDRIKLLPEKYRNILSLYLFEGFDHEEIGQILSIPSSTSRSNYSRARQRLINDLEGIRI